MNAKTIIGVDIGGTKIGIGRVERGKLVRHSSFPVDADAGENHILEQLIGAIESVFSSGVAGIGIGVPSVVDIEKGIVFDVQNIPSWKEVPLKSILENRFEKPVYVNNDANCFAVGEKHFGKGKPYKNMVGVTLGTGLGAGVIINHHLYSGANCGAGEFGVIPYKDSILEAHCSGQFFMHEYKKNGREVYESARLGDARALSIFEEFGLNLGEALKIILYAFDPEAVIFGGSVSRAFPYFEKALRRALKDYAYQRAVEQLKIEVSDQPEIAILGAAALYLDAR